ncbi:MAG: hypothetical protein NC084_13025 [Bacteroides sp.]|nr:hypothetical protein [Eubacterium sp.]MCM1419649.1 hypothetical protein [Roseburia sp.]MCM1463618.1 hypothetical protein [Bacteroides sp.]
MKKIIALILAVTLLFAATAIPVSAEEKTCLFERLKKYADTVELFRGEVTILNQKVSVSDRLVMEEGDYLVIPSGAALYLKDGAELGGSVYIEHGGKLVLEGGRVDLNGAIVSDGTVTVYTGESENEYGGAVLIVSGTFYTSPDGRLTEKKEDGTGSFDVIYSDRIMRNIYGLIVCLGKTNCDNGDVAKKPVAAVVNQRESQTNIFEDSTLVTEDFETLYPITDRYLRDEEVPFGGHAQFHAILFENGTVLETVLQIMVGSGEMKFTSVNGMDVVTAVDALEKLRETPKRSKTR